MVYFRSMGAAVSVATGGSVISPFYKRSERGSSSSGQTYLIQKIHGVALCTLPLRKEAIVLDIGLLVAIEAYEILPTKQRSHKSMILGLAGEQRGVVADCCCGQHSALQGRHLQTPVCAAAACRVVFKYCTVSEFLKFDGRRTTAKELERWRMMEWETQTELTYKFSSRR